MWSGGWPLSPLLLQREGHRQRVNQLERPTLAWGCRFSGPDPEPPARHLWHASIKNTWTTATANYADEGTGNVTVKPQDRQCRKTQVTQGMDYFSDGYFYFLNISFYFLERGMGKEKERETLMCKRHTIGCFSHTPTRGSHRNPGMYTGNCAGGNWTGDLSVRRLALIPLSHISPGCF